jgi:hypothetical protein
MRDSGASTVATARGRRRAARRAVTVLAVLATLAPAACLGGDGDAGGPPASSGPRFETTAAGTTAADTIVETTPVEQSGPDGTEPPVTLPGAPTTTAGPDAELDACEQRAHDAEVVFHPGRSMTVGRPETVDVVASTDLPADISLPR